MRIDFANLKLKEAYQVMIQCIIPRPIAWILSDNGDESHNLAPFSYFSGVTSRPPMLCVSIGRKPDGAKKDTWVNIEARLHFVVHIPSRRHSGQVSATSAGLPFGESEVVANRLALVNEKGWALPRLADCRLALLCESHQIIQVGEGPQALILGRIRQAWVDDNVATEGPALVRVDPVKLDPLGRLGADDYTGLGEVFEVPRP
jgi:flavin reductase (DIM6/NTAB) family NADH-FMN oxidoreductase RutF